VAAVVRVAVAAASADFDAGIYSGSASLIMLWALARPLVRRAHDKFFAERLHALPAARVVEKRADAGPRSEARRLNELTARISE
jgi:hypothetical protein